MQISLRGGDVRNGLGWIAVAGRDHRRRPPFFWSPSWRRNDSMRNVNARPSGGRIDSNAVPALQQLSTPVTSIEPGFILALAGYGLLWFGAIRESLADRAIIREAVMA